MKETLKKLWLWLIGFKQQNSIPNTIENKEKMLRNIFSPININPKKNTLKTNAFRPPANSDEISVNRLDYTNIDFCRELAINDQRPLDKRSFFGFAMINVENIRNSGADVVYSPIKDKNLYHSDIKIGHIMVKGEQPPSEIAEIIRKLTKKSKLYIDPNPTNKKWEGEKI